MSKKKILLFGGTGAMGNFCTEILSRSLENEVYVTSRKPHINTENVTFITGNARDRNFTEEVLQKKFDVIIDFMNYGFDEFQDRFSLLLNSTGHYIFLSSSRVYSDSKLPICENTPRLLETSMDKDFLATQRYALRKARQEDLLSQSGKRNFTIIRPYITYSDERFQLGVYEKENWLYRVMRGRSIVI